MNEKDNFSLNVLVKEYIKKKKKEKELKIYIVQKDKKKENIEQLLWKKIPVASPCKYYVTTYTLYFMIKDDPHI